jgi:UPF0716 family protein affecting phage T7 exclusion
MKKTFKNLAGTFLVLVGCVMILLPGPGLLTILTGLYLINSPRKDSLIKKIKGTKFYGHYLMNIEAHMRSTKTKLRSKFKRKIKKNEQ